MCQPACRIRAKISIIFIKNILEHKSCVERAQAPKDLKECKQIKKDMKQKMKAEREKFKEMRGDKPHKGRE